MAARASICILQAHLDALDKYKVLMKGPLTIPKGTGYIDLRGRRFTR